MPQRRGFTLIEMSIVLVIIGLLIGGILGAQEMIRASKLSRVTTDAQKFLTAELAFQTKYNELPGDFPKATAYWGAATTCPNGGGSGTCNGNGDGYIGIINGNNPVCAESWHAWRQLALAGFISGQYSGTMPTASGNWCGMRGGENGPASPLGEGGVYQFMSNAGGSSTGFFFGDFMNNMLLLGNSQNGNDVAFYPALTATAAHNIDAKMDDGMPGSGNVLGPKTTCLTNTTNAATAQYVANDTDILCMLYFKPNI